MLLGGSSVGLKDEPSRIRAQTIILPDFQVVGKGVQDREDSRLSLSLGQHLEDGAENVKPCGIVEP